MPWPFFEEIILKILMVHNYYGSSAPSGENCAFDLEVALLRSRGNDVEVFSRYSDDIRARGGWGMIKGGLSVPWNPYSALSIYEVVTRFRPDIVHVHNTFPLISPSVFYAVGDHAARVMTLHNYRLFCPAGIPMRKDQVCTECIDNKSVGPALRYGCYRGSRAATVPLAAGILLHGFLRTWSKQVDAFIVLSDFQKELMVKAGLAENKLYVKPNFCLSDCEKVPWSHRQNYVVFVGRLSKEKGIETLIRAWMAWGDQAPELRVVGDGPLRTILEKQASGTPIRFLGQLSSVQAQSEIAGAKLLILPSQCLETFGLVIVEAFAVGTPVAVSNLGSLPSIVKHGINGLVFEANNAKALLASVREAWESPSKLEMLSTGAINSFNDHYNSVANYHGLMNIYTASIDKARREK